MNSLSLPHIISDGMVIQRRKRIHIWGWDEPGTRVEALLDDLLLEFTAGFQHKAAVVQVHGHAVEKPGLHRRRRELLRQYVQHLLPYILDGIHDLNHPSESCSVENLL